jgi:ergothioneine biosynthesis protein EgtB
MQTSPLLTAADRTHLCDWYTANRARSSALFDLVSDEAYYARPIDLRHPPVFYEGHLPAFSFNTLVKKGLGGRSIDERLEVLFARGIDPHESKAGAGSAAAGWPTREEVRAFAAEADRQVLAALRDGPIEDATHPLLQRAEAAYAILEHEAMHQETLLYMWHRLPLGQKQQPRGYAPVVNGRSPEQAWVPIPAGRATLGINQNDAVFSWDNERQVHIQDVEGFAIEQHDTTNAAFLEFVEAGGYRTAAWWRDEDWAWVSSQGIAHPLFWEREGDRWLWRGMFERLDLPGAWPVYVSYAEALAFARWRGLRLPTEAEFQRAAYGTPNGEERRYPWGDAAPAAHHGTFDFASWDPRPAGSTPAGRSAWGVDDLVGNGWKWTCSPFAPFPGFEPIPSYPEYSADFFDHDHVVMKGASPATAQALIRPTFRNWFRPRYPYVYATFRCVRDA